MDTFFLNALMLVDGYKSGHAPMYPNGMTKLIKEHLKGALKWFLLVKPM